MVRHPDVGAVEGYALEALPTVNVPTIPPL
jgi:hypothetical protein